MRKLISVLCALTMIMVSAVPAFAADNNEVESAMKETAKTIAKDAEDKGWAFESEWTVIGLSRSDVISDKQIDAYVRKIAALLEGKGSSKLSSSYSSDNSRLILALTSIGFDPQSVNSYNLLEPLSNYNYVTKQGLSGPVWALIALDSHDYRIPDCKKGEKQTTRENLIDVILKSMVGDQGWTFYGQSADIDMTAMVIQSLAPYYGSNSEVKLKVDKALSWLSSVQNERGMFVTAGQIPSSETQSQVLVALSSLGIDPDSDSRFIKNGYSVIDGLMTFSNGKGFKHMASDSKINLMASRQAYYALTAWGRFRMGRTSLYDMKDIESLKEINIKISKKEREEGKEKKDEIEGTVSGKTRSLGLLKLDKEKDEVKADIITEKGMDKDKDAKVQEMEYNAKEQRAAVQRTLPWIYLGIGALAALALVLVIRKREQ